MRVRAEVLTGWTLVEDPVDGSELHPAVAWEYGIRDFTDTTGQLLVPTAPDLFTLVLETEDTVLEQIRQDPDFFILWEEPV